MLCRIAAFGPDSLCISPDEIVYRSAKQAFPIKAGIPNKAGPPHLTSGNILRVTSSGLRPPAAAATVLVALAPAEPAVFRAIVAGALAAVTIGAGTRRVDGCQFHQL